MTPQGVFVAISKVTGILAKAGIGKDSVNTQQNYKFRSIDAVYNALAPALVEAGLVMLPYVHSRTMTERTTPKGGTLFSVVLDVTFRLYAVSDGSGIDIRVCGEAMDSGDKATNKAMSAAYKYAAIQVFAIPVAGMEDADATTHEVKAEKPSGYDVWLADIEDMATHNPANLATCWKLSPAEMRAYFVAVDSTDRLKALAGGAK
jgi:hypothetical protein